ncbi:MAG: retropepsin-like aspartic protease family protein [Myxococcota bacterium]
MPRIPQVFWAAVLAVLLLLGPGGSRADGPIYRWTDQTGAYHFTSDLREVPASQRSESRDRAQANRPSRLQTYSRSPAGSGAESPESTAAALTRPHRIRPARAGQTMEIPFQRRDTLMVVDVMLNDQIRAPFLVDTGASGVSIPAAVVSRLGIRIDSDTPRLQVQTASGVVSEPVIRIDAIQLGPARVEGLDALVNSSMDIGLLGGTFFNNFVYEVDAAAQVLKLKPNDRVRKGFSESHWRRRFTEVRLQLARLEAHLEGETARGGARRDELEQGLSSARAALDALEREANAASVPRTWRE